MCTLPLSSRPGQRGVFQIDQGLALQLRAELEDLLRVLPPVEAEHHQISHGGPLNHQRRIALSNALSNRVSPVRAPAENVRSASRARGTGRISECHSARRTASGGASRPSVNGGFGSRAGRGRQGVPVAQVDVVEAWLDSLVAEH